MPDAGKNPEQLFLSPLLVGMQNGNIRVLFFTKLKYIYHMTNNVASRYLPKRNKNLCLHECPCVNVYSTFICNH